MEGCGINSTEPSDFITKEFVYYATTIIIDVNDALRLYRLYRVQWYMLLNEEQEVMCSLFHEDTPGCAWSD